MTRPAHKNVLQPSSHAGKVDGVGLKCQTFFARNSPLHISLGGVRLNLIKTSFLLGIV